MNMVDEKTLTRTLIGVAKTGKYVAGYNEVAKSVKNSKIVIASSTIDDSELKALQKTCDTTSVPFLQLEQSSIGLGKALGKQFRVSVLAIKSPGDASLKPILESIPK
jgi:ribosomal protein L30E